MKYPDGSEYDPEDLLDWLYVRTDFLVGRMAELGYPRWLYVSAGYLVGQHIWSWLNGHRPWRDW